MFVQMKQEFLDMLNDIPDQYLQAMLKMILDFGRVSKQANDMRISYIHRMRCEI